MIATDGTLPVISASNFTRMLMITSAVALGAGGMAATFAPDLLLRWSGVQTEPLAEVLIQVAGALLLAFAALNWMARENLIGGIYSRPLAVANLLHFLAAGIAVVRLVISGPTPASLWLVAALYVTFAAGFARVLFRHPLATPA